MFGCNTAPYDPHIPFSEAFLGFHPNYRRLAEIEETIRKVSNITTRKQETLSSKAQRFNSRKSKKEEELIDFGIKDYKEYLKVRKLDFIGDLIVGEEESAKALLEAEEKKKREKEEAKEREKEEMRIKEREESLKYGRGTWNAKIVDYMASIGEPDEPALDEADNGKNPEGAVIDFSPLSDSPKSPLTPDIAKSPETSSVTHGLLQQKFEVIWKNLKMPLDQRMDMAIKHGTHRNSSISTVCIVH